MITFWRGHITSRWQAIVTCLSAVLSALVETTIPKWSWGWSTCIYCTYSVVRVTFICLPELTTHFFHSLVLRRYFTHFYTIFIWSQFSRNTNTRKQGSFLPFFCTCIRLWSFVTLAQHGDEGQQSSRWHRHHCMKQLSHTKSPLRNMFICGKTMAQMICMSLHVVLVKYIWFAQGPKSEANISLSSTPESSERFHEFTLQNVDHDA